MNKLKLNLAHEAGEILSKEDMKKILGGATGSAGFGCPGRSSIKCNYGSGVVSPYRADDCYTQTILSYCNPDTIVSAYCMCDEISTGS